MLKTAVAPTSGHLNTRLGALHPLFHSLFMMALPVGPRLWPLWTLGRNQTKDPHLLGRPILKTGCVPCQAQGRLNLNLPAPLTGWHSNPAALL